MTISLLTAACCLSVAMAFYVQGITANVFERSEKIQIIMNDKYQIKRNVTVADAIKNLHENGIEVSEKQATEILDFMYFLGALIVKVHFSDNTSNSNEP